MTNKIRVLYIDDEDNNLNSFKASLRKDFHIITAIDAEDVVYPNKRTTKNFKCHCFIQ
jgi:response regulator RpfG family c-di-GMP phosphodiesterase